MYVFLDDDSWLNDLAFLVDMTKFMSEMNVSLQGKDQLVHKLYEHVVTFVQKLKLIQSQLVLKKVVHCPVLSSRPTDTVQHEKYSDLVTKLADDFEQRFQDFRRHIGTMKLISNLFSIDPTDAADKYHLELIDIQNDSDLKTAFADHDLLNFYSHYCHQTFFFDIFGPTVKKVESYHNAIRCIEFFITTLPSR